MSLRVYVIAALATMLSACSSDKFTEEQRILEMQRYSNVRTVEERKTFQLPDGLKFRSVKSVFEAVGNQQKEYEPFTLEKGHWKIVLMGMNHPSGLNYPRKFTDVQADHGWILDKLWFFISANEIDAKLYFFQLDPIEMALEETMPNLFPGGGGGCAMFYFDCVDKYVYVTHPKNDMRAIMWWLAHEDIGDFPIVRQKLKAGEPVEFKLPAIFILDENNKIVSDINAIHGFPDSEGSKYEKKRRLGIIEEYTVAINLIDALNLDWKTALQKWDAELRSPANPRGYKPCKEDCLAFKAMEKYKFSLPGYMKAQKAVESTVNEIGRAVKEAVEERGDRYSAPGTL